MAREKLVIFGAGGLGLEITTFIRDINLKKERFDILGFVDDTPELQNKTLASFPVLGDSSWLLNYNDEISVVIAIGSSLGRKKVYEKISHKQNISFPNIFVDDEKFYHPEVLDRVKGCVIGYHNLISRHAIFGDFIFIDSFCCIGHSAKLGDFTSLYVGAHVSGDVSVGNCAQIYSGARIMEKKSIGENSKIGMGSIVVQNVAANTTVFGNPAKVIC